MKKFFATILALVMVLAMSTTAFAAGPAAGSQTGVKTSQSIDVNGKYVAGQHTEDAISVDIEWGAMNFVYATGDTGTWNPTNHTYSNSSAESGWAGTKTSNIKVTNHSNVNVTASFVFTAESGYETVNGNFNKESIDLDAGVVDDYDNAANDTTIFTIGGTLASAVTDSTKVGSIAVTIAKKAA